MNELEYIEHLLERFFNGETNNNEERDLYTFFERKDLPEYLAEYQPMFAYFEKGLKDNLSNKIFEVKEEKLDREVKRKPFVKRWDFAIRTSVAVILLLLISIPYFLKDDGFDRLSGSYITRNGVRIYDKEEIEEVYKMINEEMEQRQHELDKLLDKESELSKQNRLKNDAFKEKEAVLDVDQ